MGVLLSVGAMYYWRDDIFDNFVIPQELEKTLLIDNLVDALYEINVLYNNPDYFKLKVGFWSKKQLPIWEELCKTLHYEYNPIENYDRKETEDITVDGTENEKYSKEINSSGDTSENGSENRKHVSDSVGKIDSERTGTVKDTETRNATDTKTMSNSSENSSNESRDLHTGLDITTTGKTTESVAAFNNTTPVPRTITDSNGSEKRSGSETGTVTISGNNSGSGNETLKMTGTIVHDINDSDSAESNETLKVTDTEDITNTRTGKTTSTQNDSGSRDSIDRRNTARNMRVHGNIGVTTTQKMIEEQRAVVKFNIYDYIIEDFKSEFCILVY